MGMRRRQVHDLLTVAINKMRARPVSAQRFREAVREKRHAIDARVPMQPWDDIDAEE